MNGQFAESQFAEALMPQITESQNLQDVLNSHKYVLSNIRDFIYKNSKQEYIQHNKYSQGYNLYKLMIL